MIHTKSLIRRLAYVPWLLALGLVVGWTGTAGAAAITLELDQTEVREDAGRTIIKVTAKANEATTAPIHVVLSYFDSDAAEGDQEPFNQRYRMEVPTLIIPKKDKAADAKITGDIVFLPVDDNFRGANGDFQDNGLLDDLTITITGQAGAGNTVASKAFKLVDNDKLTRNLKLRFPDPGSLNKEDEQNDVDVEIYIDGARLASKHSFDIVFKNTVGDDRNDLFDKTEMTLDDASGKTILVRDSQYRSTTAKINLGRRKKTATGTITLDPFNVPGYVAIEAAFPFGLSGRLAALTGFGTATGTEPEVTTAGQLSEGVYNLDRFPGDTDDRIDATLTQNFLVVQGIDLNSDKDTGDVIVLTADGTPVDNTKLPQTLMEQLIRPIRVLTT